MRDALAAGVKVTGCTVHVATEAVDEGPILAQEAVPVEPGDTEATLHERIKSVERRLYPETIRVFSTATLSQQKEPPHEGPAVRVRQDRPGRLRRAAWSSWATS